MAEITFLGIKCVLTRRQYGNGRPALVLTDATDGSMVATATVNLPDEPLEDGEVAIKDWSENEGMVAALVRAGVIHPPHRTVPSGFVEVPICKLKATGGQS